VVTSVEFMILQNRDTKYLTSLWSRFLPYNRTTENS